MAIDAALNIIGPNSVERWTCDNEKHYELACEAEGVFVSELERIISGQLKREFLFSPSLIGKTDIIWKEIEPSILTIGDSDGLKWIQQIVREELDRGRLLKNKIEKQKGNTYNYEIASIFSHFLSHDPVSGMFLPIYFPNHFQVDNEGEIVSVGSLFGLEKALPNLLANIKQNTDLHSIQIMDQNLNVYADNFVQMTKLALDNGLALEIF